MLYLSVIAVALLLKNARNQNILQLCILNSVLWKWFDSTCIWSNYSGNLESINIMEFDSITYGWI